QVIQATPNTAYGIADGLYLLDLLLETDTVYPEIWEEVYWFLNRCQWALANADDEVSELFMRYLYLHAKKIIDKRGWLCPKPITSTTGKHKGLMRAVAIRLLSYGLSDSKGEAAELLESGFCQLGFAAVEQYPHCGLLWWALINMRVNSVRESEITAAEPRLFDHVQFRATLNEIAFKSTLTMPAEHVIPEFGSPAQQAAFALAG
ncbi:hypothetical protein PMAYCL1PPCAC_27658, partial [Pristionchus mayeri]